MPMDRSQKTVYINEVKDLVASSLSVVAICYSGISSMDMHKLRTEAIELGVQVKVSKNTLTRIALEGSDYAALSEDMKGHILLLFAKNEPGSAAKLVKSLLKKHDFIKVCSIGLTGSKLSVSQLEQVASLPNHEQAIAMLMGTMLAPVRALATVMQETYAGLTRTMSQYADQKSKH